MTENNCVYQFHIFKTLVCISNTVAFTQSNSIDGFSFLDLKSWVVIDFSFNLYFDSIWEDINKMSKGRIIDDLSHFNMSLFIIYISLPFNSHIQISIYQAMYVKTYRLRWIEWVSFIISYILWMDNIFSQLYILNKKECCNLYTILDLKQ